MKSILNTYITFVASTFRTLFNIIFFRNLENSGLTFNKRSTSSKTISKKEVKTIILSYTNQKLSSNWEYRGIFLFYVIYKLKLNPIELKNLGVVMKHTINKTIEGYFQTTNSNSNRRNQEKHRQISFSNYELSEISLLYRIFIAAIIPPSINGEPLNFEYYFECCNRGFLSGMKKLNSDKFTDLSLYNAKHYFRDL